MKEGRTEPVFCRRCKSKYDKEVYPKVVCIDGLYYAQTKCGHYNPYEFLGLSPEKSIENWNKFQLTNDVKKVLKEHK